MCTSSKKLEVIRRNFARAVTARKGRRDARLEELFATIPREDFLPPGPWKLGSEDHYAETPSDDPASVYEDTVIALDADKGINNGQPSLHAEWLSAVAPSLGETVTHIGIGWGYYTALLSRLVGPQGQVEAIELEPHLAEEARRRLGAYGNVHVVQGDATAMPLVPSDVIYVNAGVVVPPVAWLQALKHGGRMIFPWRPTASVALALLVTRRQGGFQAHPLMQAWFIPCVGASSPQDGKLPDLTDAWAVRSIWMIAGRPPDGTEIATFRDVWFSTQEVAA